jgi:hypothetical protein
LRVHGPFLYLKQGVDLGLNLIVIAIQNTNADPRPAEVQGYLNAVKALYKVSAFIGTGLSRGGQDWDWFISNAENQTAEMAALCLASSEGAPSTEPGIPGGFQPSWLLANNVPYWQACGTADSFYSPPNGVLGKYNQLKAIAPQLAFLDTWAGVGHGDPVWADFYNPAWVSPAVGKSIYTWAASFGTGIVTPPVVPPAPSPLMIPAATPAQLAAIVSPTLWSAYINTGTGKLTIWNGTAWS